MAVKISLFAGTLGDPGRVLAVEKAAAVAAEHEANLIVLPGWSLGFGLTDGATLLQKLACKNDILILGEVQNEDDNWQTFCFRPSKPPFGPLLQIFSASKEATPCKVHELVNEFKAGKRIIEVEDKHIGILLCGENNVLHNVKKDNYTPQPQHSDIDWPLLTYDVLVNPAHTSMGQWKLLHQQFAYFSHAGRTLLYCTNNAHYYSWKTSLCVYHNENKIVMGDFDEDTIGIEFYTPIEDSWRLLTIPIP